MNTTTECFVTKTIDEGNRKTARLVQVYEIDTQMFMPSLCRVLRKPILLSEKLDRQDPTLLRSLMHLEAHRFVSFTGKKFLRLRVVIPGSKSSQVWDACQISWIWYED